MNDKELLAIGNELISSMNGIFPPEANFETFLDHSRLSFACSIYWKLGNDRNRPNKPSKIIIILISYEAIEDSNYQKRDREVQDKFRSFIDAKYKTFNPDHNEPREKSPPNEEWIVVSNILS